MERHAEINRCFYAKSLWSRVSNRFYALLEQVTISIFSFIIGICYMSRIEDIIILSSAGILDFVCNSMIVIIMKEHFSIYCL